MRYLKCLFLLLFFCGISVFSQKNYKRHKVSKGETVYRISKKYKVTPESIYELNPGSEKGIEAKSILLIPAATSDQKHKVKKKETLYGISKAYNVELDALYAANSGLKNTGLKAGAIIIIPGNSLSKSSSTKAATVEKEVKPSKSSKQNKKTADKLVFTSHKYIGVPYRTGGTTKRGMDCSGLICTVYNSENIKLPRTSKDLSLYGKKIKLSKAEKGDLIFFKTNGRRKINHVGMVVEVKRGEIKFIHASSSKGVMISSMNEAYFKKRVAQVNRVLK